MARNFIHHVNAAARRIEAEAEMDGLGLRSRRLLQLIGEAEELSASTRVGDVVRQSRLGTAPTVYSSLEELETGGWIERRRDPSDHRAATLHLTARAWRVFDRMSRGVVQLAARCAPRRPGKR